MFNMRTLGFGLLFGFLDVIALSITKAVSIGLNSTWMIVPLIVYAANPFIFLTALRKESLTVMNLVWDLTSDLLITFIGLFVFSETISPMKMLGVLFSLVGLFLMTYESSAVNEFLQRNYIVVRESLINLRT
jgi:multidrug transporter EmrE-like cation transporter